MQNFDAFQRLPQVEEKQCIESLVLNGGETFWLTARSESEESDLPANKEED